MIERGTVIKDGESITVRFGRKSECSKCNLCGFGKDDRHLDLVFKNTLGAKAGDTAEVSMAGGTVLLSSAIVYLVPLLFAAIGLIAGFAMGGDAAAIIGALAGLISGFASVALIDRLFGKKNKRFAPKLLRIIENKTENSAVEIDCDTKQ